MEYTYETKGTCSNAIVIQTEGDYIKKVKIIGGCSGNTKGISSLVEGMKIDDVIKKLKGIPCGIRTTSCPDQLAIALEEMKQKMDNEKI